MAMFADAFAERIEVHIGDALLSTAHGVSIVAPSSSSSGFKGQKDSIGELFLEVVSYRISAYIRICAFSLLFAYFFRRSLVHILNPYDTFTNVPFLL
jgi:hypothetical protein